MTYAEWMKKQAEGDQAAAQAPAETRHPLTGGEIGWNVLGGSGGALLGWTLARLLHRKPSLRTKLLYSVLGAAGGVGGANYWMDHATGADGKTPREVMRGAQETVSSDTNSIADTGDKTLNEAVTGKKTAEQATEQLIANNEAAGLPSWSGYGKITDRDYWTGLGAVLGFGRGMAIDPAKDAPAKTKAESLVFRWPGQLADTLDRKITGARVDKAIKRNAAARQTYQEAKTRYDNNTAELQKAVDKFVADRLDAYDKYAPPGASRPSQAKLRADAFKALTHLDSSGTTRTFKGNIAYLYPDGRVTAGFDPVKPDLVKIPPRAKWRGPVISRGTNAAFNATTHALAANLLNRILGASYDAVNNRFKPVVTHTVDPNVITTRTIE